MATDAGPDRARRTAELKVFVLLAGLLVPALTIVAIGGYGLAVWTYQMIAGPPGIGKAPAAVNPAANPKS